jgi:hypothetical protein
MSASIPGRWATSCCRRCSPASGGFRWWGPFPWVLFCRLVFVMPAVSTPLPPKLVSSYRRNWPQSFRMTWWQRGGDELTGAREDIVASVVRICERNPAAWAARGEFRRQMQRIKAAWKRKSVPSMKWDWGARLSKNTKPQLSYVHCGLILSNCSDKVFCFIPTAFVSLKTI